MYRNVTVTHETRISKQLYNTRCFT